MTKFTSRTALRQHGLGCIPRAKAMHESYLSGTRTHPAKMYCKQMLLTRVQKCVTKYEAPCESP